MRWFMRLLGMTPPKRSGLVIRATLKALDVEPNKKPKRPATPRPRPQAPPRRLEGAVFPPPDGEYRFLALDVETANTDMSSICQIGIATVDHSGEIRAYSTLIDPRCRFSSRFTEIHGIDAAAVRGAPTFFDVLDPLVPLLSRHTVFQHSSFDQRAIAAAYEGTRSGPPRLRWRDSVTVARRAWPEFTGAGGHGLSHLKQALRLDFQHHDAGEDAKAAAQVVLLAEERVGLPFDQIIASRAQASTPLGATFDAPRGVDGAADMPLSGRIVVFTGDLSMPRQVAATRAAAMGLSVRTSVSRKTTFVVVGGSGPNDSAPSGKHRRALELAAEGAAISVIGEAEFLALVAGEIAPPAIYVADASLPKPAPRPRPELPRPGGEIVVIASALTLEAPEISARAEASGMTVMINVTKRTTLVVVAESDLVDGAERTTRHRSAEAALANGQPLRIIGEAEFLALIGAG